MEVAELSRQFRQMLGWKEKRGRATLNTWRCRRLRVTPAAQALLFKNPKLWAIQREDGVERGVHKDVGLGSLDLVLFPLGIGLLLFHIDWLAANPCPEHNILKRGSGFFLYGFALFFF